MSLGEALVTLRRARGMTQATLADSAAVTQAALSRYENNLRDPSRDTLGSLAKSLGVTPEFLQTAGRTVLVLPLFDPLEYAPEDAARLVRMQWRMPSGPVRDLIGWLESAGCVVVAEDFGSMTGGGRVDGLSQWVADSPVMLVNDRAPTDRLRLTLAHELGHVCLHSEQLGGDPEDEANAFAAEFLMPAELIRPELRNLSLRRLHGLKRYWGVSMQALIERAHRLGTISAHQRTNLYKALSARGWRTKEPLSEELVPERTSLVERLGQVLVERGLSPEEVAVIAGAASGPDRPFFLPRTRLSVV